MLHSESAYPLSLNSLLSASVSADNISMLYDAHDDVVRVATPDDDEPPPVESNVGRPSSEFRSPPEWRKDATVNSIYLYIRHHHNGDTNSVFTPLLEHARQYRETKVLGVSKANGWQSSWNCVRVAAGSHYDGSWPAALRSHYLSTMNDYDGIPNSRPRQVRPNRIPIQRATAAIL